MPTNNCTHQCPRAFASAIDAPKRLNMPKMDTIPEGVLRQKPKYQRGENSSDGEENFSSLWGGFSNKLKEFYDDLKFYGLNTGFITLVLGVALSPFLIVFGLSLYFSQKKFRYSR